MEGQAGPRVSRLWICTAEDAESIENATSGRDPSTKGVSTKLYVVLCGV